MRQSSPLMRTLAANLYAHRKARRLTRKEVEAATGISAEVLLQYEIKPGKDAYLLPIVKLARFYNTTAEDLLEDPDPNIPPQVPKVVPVRKKKAL